VDRVAGGGHFIDGGKVTINNPKARRSSTRCAPDRQDHAARRHLYQEDQTEHRVRRRRRRLRATGRTQYSHRAGRLEGEGQVQRRAAAARPPGKSVGTVGGWQLAVSKYSKHKDAAIEFVRYMTSPAVEKFDAITNSNVPTIPSVAKDKPSSRPNPYLKPAIASVRASRARRSSSKTHYNEGSKASTRGSTRSSTARREERAAGAPVEAQQLVA
jgi:trehalose/maltose transport system substrate-binding protein